jgi:hypothetical protein
MVLKIDELAMATILIDIDRSSVQLSPLNASLIIFNMDRALVDSFGLTARSFN